MDWTGIAGLALVVVCTGLMLAFLLINRGKPPRPLREIPAFNRLRQALGLSVEAGSRVHISLGSTDLLSPQATASLVGLSVLDRVAQLSTNSDRPPVATSGEGSLAILSQDTLRSAYKAVGVSEQYDPTLGRLTGLTPFSYAAGAISTVADENVSANVFLGHFGPEVALLADVARQENAFSLAASDSLPGQSVIYATTEEPLIGEELYAAGAYLQANEAHSASLWTQDWLRWGVIVALIVGAALKLAGVP